MTPIVRRTYARVGRHCSPAMTSRRSRHADARRSVRSAAVAVALPRAATRPRPQHITTFGEGMTPLIELPRLGASLGLSRLMLKDEGACPTGTFKARGAAVGISRARELGIGRVAMPTNGNAGAAWSAYAARAGVDTLVVMPIDAPEVTRRECTVAGARLLLVDGLIGDAGAIVGRAVRDDGWFDVSTLKEPYRLEGKKTMGLEIFEQLGGRLPDVIIYPAGGGVGLIGITRRSENCARSAGMTDRRRAWSRCRPRVARRSCGPTRPVIPRDGMGGRRDGRLRPQRRQAARRPADARRDRRDRRVGDRRRGRAAAGGDARARPAGGRLHLSRGAATVAAARKLRESGWLTPDDRWSCSTREAG